MDVNGSQGSVFADEANDAGAHSYQRATVARHHGGALKGQIPTQQTDQDLFATIVSWEGHHMMGEYRSQPPMDLRSPRALPAP